MKKAISFVLMICLATTLFAGPVSRETALKVAQKVFNTSPATKGVVSTSLSITWDGEFEATRGVIDPAFYVVSRDGGGFVIVSGNDNIQPVLAFSFENPFKVEDMPANVRWWMEELKGYARSAAYPSPRALEEWAAYTDTKAVIPGAEIVSEFTGSRTNLWNQTDPANLFAPTVDVQGEKSVCGCVPLAFSEIMAWFGTNNKMAPDTYTGTIPAYTYQAGNPSTLLFDYDWTIPAHVITPTHDWAALKALANTDPDEFYGATGDVANDVGHLVYDVGTILQVQYNKSAFGGTSGNLGRIEQLATMMGYAKNALPKRRENYSGNEWVSMLSAEIDNHPVYYEGEDVTSHGGHAFVADGYATTTGGIKVIHFNFGWGGSCNGYYDCLTDLDDGHYNFFLRNVALFGFVPDLSAATSVVKRLSYFSYNGVDGGLFHTSGTIDYDPILTFKNVQNLGSTDYTGFIFCYRVDKTGAPQGGYLVNVSGGAIPVLAYIGSCDIDPYVSFTPVLGDKYALFYRNEADALTPLEGDQVGRILTEVPLYPAAFIKTEATYDAGDYFVFALTNHNYQYYDATWTITTPGGVSTDYTQQDYRVQLTASGDYKIEVTIPGQEKVTAYIHVN